MQDLRLNLSFGDKTRKILKGFVKCALRLSGKSTRRQIPAADMILNKFTAGSFLIFLISCIRTGFKTFTRQRDSIRADFRSTPTGSMRSSTKRFSPEGFLETVSNPVPVIRILENCKGRVLKTVFAIKVSVCYQNHIKDDLYMNTQIKNRPEFKKNCRA